MAKGKSGSRRGTTRPQQTYHYQNDAPSLQDFLDNPWTTPAKTPTVDLNQIEDRRQWHPEGSKRPARSFHSPLHRLTIAVPTKAHKTRNRGFLDGLRNIRRSYSSFKSLPNRIAFQAPREVMICVRRNIRKQVLHALRKTGKGGGRQRRPRYNWYSSISCRRT